jgi:hypothetical protein
VLFSLSLLISSISIFMRVFELHVLILGVGSRANFAIASSFLMQLLLTATTEAESNEIHDLVARWRWAMRIGSGSTGSGLMSLGLLRLDGLLLENGIQQAGSARRSMTSMSG